MKIGRDVIVSCGNQSVDCHQIGSGPLKPHQSIVIDVFPQSMKTFYCGDATRTFCKGKPSKELKKMYLAVLSAQEMAIKSIKEGVNGKKVHSAISKFFKECGYETYEKSGHMQGFYHGTGHTLGLEVHDGGGRPLAMADFKLKKGVVTSVEPGLYYTGIGGVRLEELIYVTKNGCEVLGGIFPKVLEIA